VFDASISRIGISLKLLLAADKNLRFWKVQVRFKLAQDWFSRAIIRSDVIGKEVGELFLIE
jgi:hypothetical protein